MTAPRTVLLAVFAVMATGAAPAQRQAQHQALAGNWAGDGFALRSTVLGYVVQGKCATGKITAPVFPDAAGNFAATGYFNQQRSGYRLSDVAARDTPARFVGKVTGDRLVLDMTVADKKVAGRADPTHFVLKRGAAMVFPKCE